MCIRDRYKGEQIITSPQGPEVITLKGPQVNLCSNNYLGLANHPDVLKAVIDGVQNHGFGMSSVRFICGTHDIHKKLETTISNFLHKEDTILYSSCFDANTGLFVVLNILKDDDLLDYVNNQRLTIKYTHTFDFIK